MSVPRGIEPFSSPSNPSETYRIQNALLREANQVLKDALVSIVERYKVLSAKHSDLQCAYDALSEHEASQQESLQAALAAVEEEEKKAKRAESAARSPGSPTRRLDDINTSVIKGVVERFAHDDYTKSPRARYDEYIEEVSPRESKGVRSARIEIEARQALRAASTPRSVHSPLAKITPTLVDHSVTTDRSLANGESPYRPSRNGEEDRIYYAGSPSK